MPLWEIHFRAMGCQMMVAVDAAPLWDTGVLEQVPEWFETWEQSLSRFRANSELSALNRANGRAFQMSPVLWAVFQEALQAERRSQGWVTPTIYDALVESGYAHSFGEGFLPVPRPAWSEPRPAPLLQAVPVDFEKQALTLPPGVRLDLGGVAKGWAADQALKRLRPVGPALVDAGGDIAVGAPLSDGQLWPVAISDPRISDPRIADPRGSEDYLELLMLSDCGVATSGRDYRRWQQQGRSQHHLINPHTGQPAETNVLSATVIAPTVMEAEMAAKVVLLSGYPDGLDWLDAQAGYEGRIFLEDGRRLSSRYLQDFLWRDE